MAGLSEGSRAQEGVDTLAGRFDGKPAATQAYRRRRAAIFNVLR